MRQVSPSGRDFIQHLEGGGRPHAYQDQAGIWTLGVGHVLRRSELMSGKIGLTMYIPWHHGLTVDEMEELFRSDLQPVEQAINTLVRRLLTQNQFDALASTIFNIGVEAFRHSTMLKRLNTGDYAGVAEEMMKWVYAAGKVLPDLRYRRSREVSLWNALPEGAPPGATPKEV